MKFVKYLCRIISALLSLCFVYFNGIFMEILLKSNMIKKVSFYTLIFVSHNTEVFRGSKTFYLLFVQDNGIIRKI